MVNNDSSVGITEDLITNIMHLSATESHLAILIRKYEDMITFWHYDGSPEMQSTSDIEEIEKLEEKIATLRISLQKVTEQRRTSMRVLKGQSNIKGNADLWCTLKHVLTALETIFECWQVDLSNEDLKQAFIDQSRLVNEFMAMFLGYEVTPCSACLTDQLKSEGK